MTRVLLLAALALACVASPALAAGSILNVPLGDMLKEVLSAVGPAVITVVGFVITNAIRKVSPILGAFVSEKLVDSVLQKWLDYAINAVPGAEKGSTLTVEVGSQVIAAALQRGVDRAQASGLGAMLMRWAGGEQEAANKLFRMLKLEPRADVGVLDSALADLRGARA